ncbi:MAG TPA: peptide chain release factor N(5)-glutamine methyltransferase [Jatrophihabitans sp.]|nr:peptide chain release factor N(5)-glutamine methyltransferase [Jatrophihabitans sp.]
MSAPSVAGELRAATERLAAAGAGSPRVDAELLLAHLLGLSRGRLLLVTGLTDAQRAAYAELVGRRAAGVPLQHLTGRAPYRYLELAVGPGVFVPRPETELILELAAPELARAGRVVDLCAGSGAIALAVAQEFPQAAVWAVERSPDAAGWLRRNAAERAAAGDRPVEVVQADVADGRLLAGLRVDVVLSNPPYVPATLRSRLAAEVGHDPDEAVFAGPDGLALMPALLATAARLLAPGGLLVLEHDASHGAALPALLAAAGDWQEISGHPDLAGRPRFARAVRTRSNAAAGGG